MTKTFKKLREDFSYVGKDVSQKLSYDNWLKKVKGIAKGAHGIKGDEHTKYSKEWQKYKKEEVELEEASIPKAALQYIHDWMGKMNVDFYDMTPKEIMKTYNELPADKKAKYNKGPMVKVPDFSKEEVDLVKEEAPPWEYVMGNLTKDDKDTLQDFSDNFGPRVGGNIKYATKYAVDKILANTEKNLQKLSPAGKKAYKDLKKKIKTGPVFKKVKEEVELEEGYEGHIIAHLGELGIDTRFSYSKLVVKKADLERVKDSLKDGVSDRGSLIYGKKIPAIITEGIDLEEGRMKELHTLIQQGKSAEEIAKIMKVDVKTVKSLMPKEDLDEVSPPGWGGSVKAMKKHADIDNPYALAWHMKNKGDKPHYKDKDGTPVKKDKYKDEQMEQVKEQSYKDKFNAALKHFSINSIGDLKSDEEKKKFFNYVDSKHKADNEEVKKEETNMKKEDHDCAKVHPDKPHQEWEKDNLKKAQYETHKYFDTKPGSIEDSINKVNELEEASVTINKKEIDDLVKQYIAKGGIVTKLPPALKPKPDETPPKEWDLALGKFVPGSKQGQIAYKVKKVGSGYKILKAELREFIRIYNEHFLTTYAAEEFIVEKEKEKEEGAMKRGKHLDTFKPKPKEK